MGGQSRCTGDPSEEEDSMKRFLQPPPPPEPSPVRIVGPKGRGDFNFGLYANVEREVAELMAQGYEPKRLTFKGDVPVVFMVRKEAGNASE
jgi:hypothetical protein